MLPRMEKKRDPVPRWHYYWIALFALWWLAGFMLGER